MDWLQLYFQYKTITGIIGYIIGIVGVILMIVNVRRK